MRTRHIVGGGPDNANGDGIRSSGNQAVNGRELIGTDIVSAARLRTRIVGTPY